jgi:hypothetical protein
MKINVLIAASLIALTVPFPYFAQQRQQATQRPASAAAGTARCAAVGQPGRNRTGDQHLVSRQPGARASRNLGGWSHEPPALSPRPTQPLPPLARKCGGCRCQFARCDSGESI